MQSIDFGQDGDDACYLGAGWSAAEPGYRWMIGEESELWLENPGEGKSFVLEMELTPFCTQPTVPSQRIAVTVRGTLVGEAVLQEQETVGFRIQAETLSGKGPVRLILTHPDAARPVDHGHPNDGRVLSVAMRGLRLYRLNEEVPRFNIQGSERLTADELESRTGLPASRFMVQFESLGDNCEFGLVQRRCGAEPLGLLRFSNIKLAPLLGAIRSDFAGIGDPANLEFWQDDSERREYIIRDLPLSLVFHTFLYDGQVDEAMLLEQQAVRMRFLRRKLLEDLANGEKIFVVKRNQPIAEQEILPLYLALNRYGSNTVLWVVPADEKNPPGTVEQVLPGLLRGYIDRFAPYENAHDLSFGVWLRLCANARQFVPGAVDAA